MLQKANPSDSELFSNWTRASRLETMTCRPVVDGKRLSAASEPDVLAFYQEGVSSPIGKVSFFDWNPRNRSVEFGYLLDPAWRGKGLGQAMVRLAVEVRFRTTDVHKIYAQTASFNLPSVKILDCLGFHRDAVLRDHHELDGVFYDDLIYSILRPEWERCLGNP